MKAAKCPAAVLLLLLGAFGRASGQTVTMLYSFGGGDGMDPTAALVQGSDGNFYGTTFAGGASTNCSAVNPAISFGTTGCGTVFQISPSGTLTTLYSFSGSDGANPLGALVVGDDGNYYGTTYQGGTNGMGTVFRISSSGTFASIHSFSGSDGKFPYAGLLFGSDGNFYGTTYQGGSGGGNVFRISPAGVCTNLHSFSGSDGLNPRGSLAQGSDGNFYGTTYLGGFSSLTNCPGGCGTVFRISPSGNFTNLHLFTQGSGSRPFAGVFQGSDGIFYGTTSSGQCPGGVGCDSDFGVAFRMSPQGTYTELFPVSGMVSNFDKLADVPLGGLIQASDGQYYGLARGGSQMFRFDPADGEVGFQATSGSSAPMIYARVVQGTDGSFYGTSIWGGISSNCINGCGMVYKVSAPLGSAPYPINQITNVQIVATNVVFKVVSISGETYQLQFSGSMSPTNWINVSGVSVTNSIGALLTLTNFGGASSPQGFYRFAITP